MIIHPFMLRNGPSPTLGCEVKEVEAACSVIPDRRALGGPGRRPLALPLLGDPRGRGQGARLQREEAAETRPNLPASSPASLFVLFCASLTFLHAPHLSLTPLFLRHVGAVPV